MENEKQNESQELSAQELATISGGIAEGEPYPTEPYPSEYPIDDKYNHLSEAIAKKLENIKLPDFNHKTPNDYPSF
jgi:bacteriocin-like protein